MISQLGFSHFQVWDFGILTPFPPILQFCGQQLTSGILGEINHALCAGLRRPGHVKTVVVCVIVGLNARKKTGSWDINLYASNEAWDI